MDGRWVFIVFIICGFLLFLLDYDLLGLVLLIVGLIGAIYYWVQEGFLGREVAEEEIPDELFL